jgi:hypothetical protein
VLNWVLEGEDTTLGLGFITNVGVLLTHTNHHTLVARATNDGREDSAGCIITGETSFAHTRTVVDDKGSNIFVTHFE